MARAKRTEPQRLVSLDLLRGLAVIGMIIVNEMAGMQPPVYRLLLHSRWDGLTIADVVFPAFLFMVGVSIPLAFFHCSLTSFLRKEPRIAHSHMSGIVRCRRTDSSIDPR